MVETPSRHPTTHLERPAARMLQQEVRSAILDQRQPLQPRTEQSALRYVKVSSQSRRTDSIRNDLSRSPDETLSRLGNALLADGYWKIYLEGGTGDAPVATRASWAR
jgi:hypothetical protein